jgi:hypothetical protein
MTIGQAYSEALTPREQKALLHACDWLIDHAFEEYKDIKEPKDVLDSTLGSYLPTRYASRYTPLFYKQFAVCVTTVAWKLAQPTHIPLSSLAEELAARAIIEQARVLLEVEADLNEDTKEREDEEETEEPFDAFIDLYFEDTDFEFLFEARHDGIDETAVGAMLGMSSLAFADWFVPFSDEPSRIAHPYVSKEESD